jgi:hypothetical protein
LTISSLGWILLTQSTPFNLTISFTALKKRRDYEIEGFTNDILMLRKQLKVLEKNILKYGPLEDKELILLSLGSHNWINNQLETREKRQRKYQQNFRV